MNRDTLEQEPCEIIAKAFQFGMALGFAKKHDEMDKVMEEVKKAVTPQPKTGHWIKMLLTDMSDIAGQCSECGFIHKFISGHTAQYNYCPNCGAKMSEITTGSESEEAE